MDAKSKGQSRFGVRNKCGRSANQCLISERFWPLKSQIPNTTVKTKNWITTDGMQSLGYFFMFLSSTYQPRPTQIGAAMQITSPMLALSEPFNSMKATPRTARSAETMVPHCRRRATMEVHAATTKLWSDVMKAALAPVVPRV